MIEVKALNEDHIVMDDLMKDKVLLEEDAVVEESDQDTLPSSMPETLLVEAVEGSSAADSQETAPTEANLAELEWLYFQSFGDRKSTRLNSSHGYISYAVFCLKKK